MRSTANLWMMICAAALPLSARAQAPAAAAAPTEPAQIGAALFQQMCVICHGPTGTGSFIGPSLVSAAAKSKGDRELRKAISEGNNDKGMPAFGRGLKKIEMDGLVAHLRNLQTRVLEKRSGNDAVSPVPAGGSIAAGEDLFRGKAACINCHTVHYSGGMIGPDLSFVAERLTPGAIYKSVTAPSERVGIDQKVKEITLKDGKTVKGKMRGETGKSVQILNREGYLWTTYMTDDMTTSKTLKESLMPDKLLDPLTPQETQDLFAFLGDLK